MDNRNDKNCRELNVDLGVALDIVRQAVHRAYIFSGFCFNAAADSSFKDYDLVKHSNIALVRSGADEDTIRHYKNEYKSWAIGAAFQEMVNAYHTFLDKVYTGVLFFQMHNKKFNSKLLQEKGKSFHMAGFPNKLNTLRDQGVAISNWDITALKSINKARCCLTHARGIVRKKDCNSDDVVNNLVLEWRFYEGSILELDGKSHTLSKVSNTSPLYLEHGATISIQYEKMKKIFPLNMSITLTAQELCQILYYMWELANNIKDSALGIAKEHDVQLIEHIIKQ